MSTAAIDPLCFERDAMTREQWLRWRDKIPGTIGSSDAPAAVLKVDLYGKTVLGLVLDKMGVGTKDNPTEDMEIGTDMEPVLGRWWERRTSKKIYRTQVCVTNYEFPWLRATLDAVATDGTIGEFKNCGYGSPAFQFLGSEDTDEVPAHFLIQCHQQMLASEHITGIDASQVIVGVMIGGNRFKQYPIKRDESLISIVFDACQEVHNRIINRDPPPPSLPEDIENIARLFTSPRGETCFSQEQYEAVMRWDGIRHGRLESEKAEKAAKADVLLALGDYASALLPDGKTLRRKLIERQDPPRPAQTVSFFDLRIVKGGK